MTKTLIVFLMLGSLMGAKAATTQIRVFVALCDNKTQGIIPVGEKIGNGDDPEDNLYWGCSDGLGSFFRKSGNWKLVNSPKDLSPSVLRRLEFEHQQKDMKLIADAYRGADIRQCVRDFEEAAASGKFDVVAFIGHNGLMDFSLPPPRRVEGNHTGVMVLCCLSEKYFGDRLRILGCETLLMTEQLMYPGSFLLHAAIESWSKKASPEEIRAAAAAAYAKNQKISVRAAMGVFSKPLRAVSQKGVDDP